MGSYKYGLLSKITIRITYIYIYIYLGDLSPHLYIATHEPSKYGPVWAFRVPIRGFEFP